VDNSWCLDIDALIYHESLCSTVSLITLQRQKVMRGLVRMLIMFGPMIFRQVQKFQRNRSRQVAAPQQRQPTRQAQQPQTQQQQPQAKNQENIPEEGDFVDPINN